MEIKETCPKCNCNNTRRVYSVSSSFIYCDNCKEAIEHLAKSSNIIEKNTIEYLLKNTKIVPIILSESGEYVPIKIRDYAQKYNKTIHIISNSISMNPISIQLSKAMQQYNNQLIIFEDIESFTKDQLKLIHHLKTLSFQVEVICFADKSEYKNSLCYTDPLFSIVD